MRRTEEMIVVFVLGCFVTIVLGIFDKPAPVRIWPLDLESGTFQAGNCKTMRLRTNFEKQIIKVECVDGPGGAELPVTVTYPEVTPVFQTDSK